MTLKIVFFGTPPIAAQILEYLIAHQVEVVAIVTRPDTPKGRSQKLLPSAVKALSLEKWPQIPLFTPEKASTTDFVEKIEEFHPDVFIVVAYGEIIKENLLSVPQKKCINVHFSLLPKYRGAAPIQRAIMSGEQKTGISIMEMALKMDAGDIIKTIEIPLSEESTFGELEQKLSDLSGPALIEVLEKLEAGTLTQTPQQHEKMTLAPKITLDDRLIDWNKNAEELHNQIRGLSPSPGAFTYVEVDGETKRLGIKKAKIAPNPSSLPGETILWDKDQWIISCKKGTLELLEVQLEGKKSLPIQDFLRGHPQKLSIKI